MYPSLDRNSPIPLYVQIEQAFEDMILSRSLSADELLPGVPLLAQQLNVSAFTVQKAYRNLQERGLIYSILGKGTFVAEAGENAFVGILIHNEVLVQAPQLPTVPLMIGFLRDALMKAGLTVRILTDMNRRQEGMSPLSAEVMSVLVNDRVAGLISLGHFGSEAFFELTRQRSIPTIGFDAFQSSFDLAIWNDWADLMRMGLMQLKRDGRQRIAVLWLDNFRDQQRPPRQLEGVETVFSELGIPYDPERIIGVHQATDWAGYHTLNHLWTQSNRPDGLLIMDDVIGRGVLMGTMAHQVRVPDELAIVVQSNAESPIVFPNEWHRYEYDLCTIANQIVHFMRDMMAGKPAPRQFTFKPTWRYAMPSIAQQADCFSTAGNNGVR